MSTHDFTHFRVTALPDYGPVVVRGEAVVVVPVASDGALWLAHIHRPAAGRAGWEFPGGAVEKGETPLAAARRELFEECGLEGGRARVWPTALEPAPGMARFPHQVVRIADVGPRGRRARPQASEGIGAVRRFTPARVRGLIRRGEIFSQPTLSALLVTGVLD